MLIPIRLCHPLESDAMPKHWGGVVMMQSSGLCLTRLEMGHKQEERLESPE